MSVDHRPRGAKEETMDKARRTTTLCSVSAAASLAMALATSWVTAPASAQQPPIKVGLL